MNALRSVSYFGLIKHTISFTPPPLLLLHLKKPYRVHPQPTDLLAKSTTPPHPDPLPKWRGNRDKLISSSPVSPARLTSHLCSFIQDLQILMIRK